VDSIEHRSAITGQIVLVKHGSEKLLARITGDSYWSSKPYRQRSSKYGWFGHWAVTVRWLKSGRKAEVAVADVLGEADAVTAVSQLGEEA
jgi:hypothetical protein